MDVHAPESCRRPRDDDAGTRKVITHEAGKCIPTIQCGRQHDRRPGVRGSQQGVKIGTDAEGRVQENAPVSSWQKCGMLTNRTRVRSSYEVARLSCISPGLPVTLERMLEIDPGFSLATTCGPAAWAGDRSPRQRWQAGRLTWVGHEGDAITWRHVSQPESGLLRISGTADPALDREWLRNVLGIETRLPPFTDPVIRNLADRFPGLRPMSDGGLFAGLLTSIVGQSVSLAAAATTQRKLCLLFNPGFELDGRLYHALPQVKDLADASPALIRTSGVTTRRAEAIVHAAKCQLAGELPDDEFARSRPEETVSQLLDLPGVGRWTAESAVLWGVGSPDAHPVNDVALLRAARHAYERPDMTMRELDALAEHWRPGRSLAARLLWTNLFGPAPDH